MIAQKTVQEKPLTEHEKALKGLILIPEPDEQRFLIERIASWETANPDPRNDTTPLKGVFRVVYTLLKQRIPSNPSRPARRPHLTYGELKDALIRANQINEVKFAVTWMEIFDTVIIHLQDVIIQERKMRQAQTRPRTIQ